VGQLPIFQAAAASPAEFVSFWSLLYRDPREALYDESIGHPLTPDRVRNLYIWKNGGPLSAGKLKSIESNYVSRIPETEGLPAELSPRAFLDRFTAGGAIWRIFWLHCWQPDRFPIYDVHVHRAMAVIETGRPEELDRIDDREKVTLYLNRYLAFCERFRSLNQRHVDRALWTFGKFIRDYAPLAAPGPAQALSNSAGL
jgi:hypothetical protein